MNNVRTNSNLIELDKRTLQIENKIISCLHSIAPEVDLKNLKKDIPLRDQIDIDSLDFIRIIVRLHEIFAIDIPERDYSRLTTMKSAVEYFNEKTTTI